MPLINKAFKLKFLYSKKSRKPRQNSATLPKRQKNIFKSINHHSSKNYHLKYHSNCSYEKNTVLNNSNNSSSVIDNNFKNQIKVPYSKIKKKTERKTIPIKNNLNDDIKNKSAVFTYKGNFEINKKSFSNEQSSNNKIYPFFIDNDENLLNHKDSSNNKKVNKALFKNKLFIKILKKLEFSKDKYSFELLHKNILNNTFKEDLNNNILIGNQKINNEHHRQINEIKNYLFLLNKENEDLFNNDKNFESSLINNSLFISNSTDNKINSNKYFKKVQKKINSAKYKRNKQNLQNKSADIIYSKYFNSNKLSFDFKIQNLKYEIQESAKRNLLSFFNNNSIIIKENNKKEESKIKHDFPKYINLNNKFHKCNNIIFTHNRIMQKVKNKENMSLNFGDGKQEMIIKFNNFLKNYKFNKLNVKNSNILNCFAKNLNGILFSNKLVNKKINQYLFNPNKLKLEINKKNEIKVGINQIFKNNNFLGNKKNKEISYNILNLKKEYKNKNLSLHAQSKNINSFLNNSFSEKILFVNKLNNDIDIGFLNEESKNNIKQKKEKLKENRSELFDNYKDFRLIKNEEVNKEKNNIISFLNNKSFNKRNKDKKEKIIEGKYEKRIKELNNKIKGRKDNKLYRLKK